MKPGGVHAALAHPGSIEDCTAPVCQLAVRERTGRMTGREALRIILADVASTVDATRLRVLANEVRRRVDAQGADGAQWGDWVRTMGTVAAEWNDERLVQAIAGAVGRLERKTRRAGPVH